MVLDAGGSLWNSNHQHHPLHVSCLKLAARVPAHGSNVDCHQERWLLQNGQCSRVHVPPGEADFDAQEVTVVGPGATSTMQSVPGIWGTRNPHWISQAVLPQLPFFYSSIRASQLSPHLL